MSVLRRDRSRGIENEMTEKRLLWVVAMMSLFSLTNIVCGMVLGPDSVPVSKPAPLPLVIQTENPEVIKQLGELAKLIARMSTEREAVSVTEKPGSEPGTLMLIDSQTGVPFQSDEKQMVRITGGEYEIITYYKDGKYINIPALYGAENIPAPRPPKMEIYDGGTRREIQFPTPGPRLEREE